MALIIGDCNLGKRLGRLSRAHPIGASVPSLRRVFFARRQLPGYCVLHCLREVSASDGPSSHVQPFLTYEKKDFSSQISL